MLSENFSRRAIYFVYNNMRVKFAKAVTLVIVVLNVVAFYFLWNLLSRQKGSSSNPKYKVVVTDDVRNDYHQRNMDDLIQHNVTVIFREFEYFENDIPNSVRSIASTYPNINILIISNSLPYPPLLFNSSNCLFQNVKHVHLQSSLNNSFKARTPLYQLDTNYVLFMPDSSRIHSKKTIEKMLKGARKTGIVGGTFKASKAVACLNSHINQREWFIQFEESFNSPLCDFIKGKHAILVQTDILKEMTDSFMLPFPDAFYIQAAAKGVKVLGWRFKTMWS